MNYQITSLKGNGKEIVGRIIGSNRSQLVIPPKVKHADLQAGKGKGAEKMVGLFSSGTTGSPKCIWNEFEKLRINAIHSASTFDITSSHSLLILAAPWHVAGLSWAIMAEELGCRYEFVTTRKGEEIVWYQSLENFNPDYLFTVPAVLRSFFGKDWKADNIVFGGNSMDPSEFQGLTKHCEWIYQGYGQTEAGGLIAAHKHHNSEPYKENEFQCCGTPVEGVEIYCKGNSKDDPAPIFIQSKTAFTPKKYHTRDIGYKDEMGNIYVLGRSDEVLTVK